MFDDTHPPKFTKNVKKIGGKMPRGIFQGWVKVLMFFLAVENYQPHVPTIIWKLLSFKYYIYIYLKKKIITHFLSQLI